MTDQGNAHVIDRAMHLVVLELVHARKGWLNLPEPRQSDIDFDYQKERDGDAQ